MALEWQVEYELGFKEIDAQHRLFVEALNRLYNAIYQSQPREVVASVLADIRKYVDEHFALEERYFKEFSFEGAAEHKEAHNDFSKKFAIIESDFVNKDMILNVELVDFLEDWLVGHVLLMDKKYVACFKEHGLV